MKEGEQQEGTRKSGAGRTRYEGVLGEALDLTFH